MQAKVTRFSQSRRRLPAILTEFVWFQFRLKEPYHQFVRVLLGQMFGHTEHFLPYIVEMQKIIDPPLEALFRTLRERGLVRSDIDLKELIAAFKTLHLGLTGLWAVEGPPFKATEKVLKLQMNLFSEGLAARTR